MKRRGLARLAAGAAAWPFAAGAQDQPRRMPLVGLLSSLTQSDTDVPMRIDAFKKGLEALGWVEGRTLRIEQRWAGAEASAVERNTAELVALKPDVILANGTPVIVALKKKTTSIPIVMALVTDPVGLGLVESLGRPGGNITGFTFVNPELLGKWWSLLVEIAPSTKRAAVLFNPALNPQYIAFVREIAKPGGPSIELGTVQDSESLRSAVEALSRARDAAAIFPPDSFVIGHIEEAAALTLANRLPAVSVYQPFAANGGMLSYGPDVADIFRRSAGYIDRILKGAKPAELPVQQPDLYNFTINLKTARKFGLTPSQSMLARADQVIE
jgi:putative tryptophan/tyrosine transport system substrate-binding protein